MYKELTSFLEDSGVQLVAVSKTKPLSAIQDLYQQGQRSFGENRVQELVQKYEALPKDIEWHMIGVLQRNKVKYIAPFVELIHSVDSLELAKTINKEATKNGRRINVLLQVKVAQEESKHGYNLKSLESDLPELLKLEQLNFSGIMGMGTFTDDEEITAMEFKSLKDVYDKLRLTSFKQTDSFRTLSMGMSGDYKIAIKEGSSLVRIGSLLFGSRY